MTKTVMEKMQLKSNLGDLYTFSQLRLFKYDSQQIKRKQAQAWRDGSAPWWLTTVAPVSEESHTLFWPPWALHT